MTAVARRSAVAAENHQGTPQLPGLTRAALARSKAELASFFRNWQSLIFTIALPALMLVVFGAVFNGTIRGTETDYRLFFVAGIIATGVMSTCFQSLAISISLDRDDGLIRRLASSPMPKAAYFIGITVKAIVTSLLEVVILMALGMALYGLTLPQDAGHWLTFVWVIFFGVTSCSLAGIAYTALIPNARSAAAIATPPFIILQFISGVFFPLTMIPEFLRTIASFFPLLWLSKGLRYVFLPETMATAEPGGAWDLGLVALVLGLWTIGGLAVVALTFKWRGPRVK